jgi:hypothetical protein
MAEVGLTMAMIPALVLLMMLVLALAALPIVLIGHTWRWVLPLALIGGIWAIVTAELSAEFSPERKHPDSLAYLLDADQGKAWWLTFDSESDSWTRPVLGGSPTRASFGKYHLFWTSDSLLSAPARPSGAAPARVELLGSRKVAGGRRVHFRITAEGPVELVSLRTAREGLHLTDMVLDGRPLEQSDSTTSPYAPKYRIGADGTILNYFGMPVTGIEVECTIDAAGPLLVLVSVTRSGLPPLKPGVTVPMRPNGFVAKPFIPTDVSIVAKTFRI